MILRHRDRELLTFEWKDPEGVRVLSVNDAERKFLPLEMKGEATDAALWRWLVHRTVPKHRHYVDLMLGKLGIKRHEVRPIIEIGRGLSLNDVHWVTQDSFKGTWAEYNLYDNRFSKTLALLAITGGGDPGSEERIGTSSPELTTNGMLAKCWRRTGDGVVLYKGGLEGAANVGFEPYSEFYASQIAETMGLEHVAYGLERFKGRLCSTCPLFTSDRYGYLPAGRVVDRNAALADSRFEDVFLFDAVIFNTDRHLGNFGYLVDNDTNEIVGAAPIFDNGCGLFSLAMNRPGEASDEFHDLRLFVNRVAPALYPGWMGFPHKFTPAMQVKLMKLQGFRFSRHRYYNLDAERLEKIEIFLQNRVNNLIEFGDKADDLLEIPRNHDTVIPVNSVCDTVNAGTGTAVDSLTLQIKENMRADPCISAGEIADVLQVSLSTVKRAIAALKAQGELRRVGSDRRGSWVVEK